MEGRHSPIYCPPSSIRQDPYKRPRAGYPGFRPVVPTCGCLFCWMAFCEDDDSTVAGFVFVLPQTNCLVQEDIYVSSIVVVLHAECYPYMHAGCRPAEKGYPCLSDIHTYMITSHQPFTVVTFTTKVIEAYSQLGQLDPRPSCPCAPRMGIPLTLLHAPPEPGSFLSPSSIPWRHCSARTK